MLPTHVVTDVWPPRQKTSLGLWTSWGLDSASPPVTDYFTARFVLGTIRPWYTSSLVQFVLDTLRPWNTFQGRSGWWRATKNQQRHGAAGKIRHPDAMLVVHVQYYPDRKLTIVHRALLTLSIFYYPPVQYCTARWLLPKNMYMKSCTQYT
jgi:hypothetical protein